MGLLTVRMTEQNGANALNPEESSLKGIDCENQTQEEKNPSDDAFKVTETMAVEENGDLDDMMAMTSNVPSERRHDLFANLGVGEYVVALYDGAVYVGKVEEIDHTVILISRKRQNSCTDGQKELTNYG